MGRVVVTVWEEWVASPGPDGPCPQCLALHGTRWRLGEGPQPPLHPHCRCRRVTVGTEVSRVEEGEP